MNSSAIGDDVLSDSGLSLESAYLDRPSARAIFNHAVALALDAGH